MTYETHYDQSQFWLRKYESPEAPSIYLRRCGPLHPRHQMAIRDDIASDAEALTWAELLRVGYAECEG